MKNNNNEEHHGLWTPQIDNIQEFSPPFHIEDQKTRFHSSSEMRTPQIRSISCMRWFCDAKSLNIGFTGI